MDNTTDRWPEGRPPTELNTAVFTSDEASDIPARSEPQSLTEKRLLADTIHSGAVSVDDNTGASARYLFFFYGSLMDPDVLQTIVGDPEEPALLDACIEGYQMKMWQGIYPTLLPLEGSSDEPEHAGRTMNGRSSEVSQQSGTPTPRIYGKAWYASTMEQCLALQSYETSAYEPSDCKIHVIEKLHDGEGEKVIGGLTFVWAGKPSDEQLKEGVFSLEHWIKEVKPKVWR